MTTTYHDPNAAHRPISEALAVSPEPRHKLSPATFASLIGVFILLGYVTATTACLLTPRLLPGWILVPLGFLFSFFGLEATARTTDWRGSLIGHIAANAGFGLILSPLLALESARWLWSSFMVVFCGTSLLTVVAALAPRVVRAFGSSAVATGLAWGLLYFTYPAWATILPHLPEPRAGATIAALVYLAYTDRYWTRALDLPRTIDNAVDSACAIYAGVLNSFLSLLEDSAPKK